MEKFLTKAEVCHHLNCSLSSVNRLLKRGELPHCKIGEMVRVRMTDVEKLTANKPEEKN